MKIFSDISGRRILASPLGWGLGHAARLVPVIRALKKNNSVTVLCGRAALGFLKSEIPDTEIIPINDWPIIYPKSRITFGTILLRWMPAMLRNTIHEHMAGRRIIRERGINLVVSDNRYGLCFKNVECLMITHQVCPQMPEGLQALGKVSNFIFKKILSLYNKVLIPDFESGFSLTGALSGNCVNSDGKFVRIGILSRFGGTPTKTILQKKYDIMVLISGQESQRTVFENQMIEYLKTQNGKKAIFVRGVDSDTPELEDTGSIHFVNRLTGSELMNAIMESELIVCRSGYSTIMDLLALGKKAMLVPTPGQTEQEYLAQRLDGRFGFTKFS